MSSRAGFHDVRFADRLQAEAVAAGERRDGRARRDAAAEAAALDAVADFETRIVARARALPDADKLKDATRRVRTVVTMVIAVALILGAIAGAAAGRAALASPREPVNMFLVLLGLLGVQSLLLVVWFAMFLLGQRLLRRGSLGGWLMRAAQSATRRLLSQKYHLAALEAYGRLAMRGRAGAWLVSGVSHQVWAMFNIGVLLMIVVLLSTNQYNFVWETTTRTEDQYVVLTRAIAAWPDRLGFQTPTDEQIRASRHVKGEPSPVLHDRNRQIAWAGLLIGCIVTFGLLPRLLLGAVSVFGGWLARRRVRLDLDAPEYAVLRPILMPAATHLQEEARSPHDDAKPHHARANIAAPPEKDTRPVGAPAIVGLEIERPACTWPPLIHGMTWDDAGIIDSGADRKKLLDALRTSHTRPSTLAVVCDLPATPDRGVQSLLAELAEASGAPLTVILTAGHRLRERADAESMAHRLEDWSAIARSAGVANERILEVDFNHLTDRSIARLRAAVMNSVQADAAHAPAAREAYRLRDAMTTIADHAAGWAGDPTHSDVLQLHREIASIYHASLRREAQLVGGVGALVRDIRSGGSDIGANVQHGVRSMLEQLPARLRNQPKWIAAGAAAGAFGCLALTLSIAPAAIAALPAWTALGAAASAGLRLALPERSESREADAASLAERSNAIRAAALFAVVLDLQGRPEREITRIIDATFPEPTDDQPVDLNDAAGAQRWLESIAGRYDRAAARGVFSP